MKTVVLIGDSLRLCYQSRVAELLGGDVKIYAPDENCRFTKYALWGMKLWMAGWGDPKPDVIHIFMPQSVYFVKRQFSSGA